MAMTVEYKKARKLDDLVVAEFPDQLMISHKEGKGQACLCLRPEEFDSMTGRQIIKRFNAHIDTILDGIVNGRPVEIADGEPQLKQMAMSKHWVPAGDVLRCIVDWDSNGRGEDGLGELAIRIDDKLLTGRQFLDLIETYEGWGMRIEFMHPNRLTNPPEVLVRQKGKKQ